MADYQWTGSWAPNGSTNQRMRVRVNVTVSEPGSGDTTVNVSGTVKLMAGYSFYHNGALMNRWGTLIGSTITDDPFNANVPTNGEQTIFTFNRSAGIGTSPSSLSFGFSVRGISYVGSSTIANVTGNIPLPARTSFPRPTGFVASWPSSTSSNIRLTWNGGPIHAIQYRRRTVAGSDNASWTGWSAYSGVEQSSPYTVDAIGGWYEYQFRIRRGTGSAASAWVDSNFVRTFLQPNKPTNINVTRQSDTRHTVTWSYNNTWDRPVQYFSINRYSTKSGTWVRIAAPPGSARSWVDPTNYSNDYIGYRVFAVNAWADIQSDDSAFIRTTPAAATSVVATRTGPNSALLEWHNNATAASNIDVQYQTSSNQGVTWTSWANLSGHTGITPAAQSRALGGLDPALWYRFRLATVALNNPGIPNLVAWSPASGIIRPANPPNAPTMLAPQGILSSIEPVIFRWQHNPTDGSTQTAYHLRYRMVGDPTWIEFEATTSGADYRYVDITDPGTYEAQVRTRGQHATYSAWSSTLAFEVLDPPAVEITYPAPDQAVPSNRARVTFTYNDATTSAIVRYRAELHRLDGLGGGELIETLTRNVTEPATEISFQFDTVLDNFASYSVIVWATSGTGLESEPYSVEFTTDFLLPEPPDLTGDWFESEGLTRLGIQNHLGVPGVTVDTVYNRIERSDDLGETWGVIADNQPLEAGFEDLYVPLNRIVWYRAVAVAEWETEAHSNIVELDTRTTLLWLMGETSGLMFSLECDLDWGSTFDHDVVTQQYFGYEDPHAHFGEARPVTVAISGTVTSQRVGCDRPLSDERDPHPILGQRVFYRDPTGRTFWGVVDSGGVSVAQSLLWQQDISMSVRKVHHA